MKCRRKYNKVALIFLAIMLIGANTFVYANETEPKSTEKEAVESETSQENLAELYHRAGLANPQVIINTLESLGISNEELQEYIGQGKKIFDILQEKEVSMVRFKKALRIEYKCKIKEATKSKTITKKEAKILNDLLKERMANWEI